MANKYLVLTGNKAETLAKNSTATGTRWSLLACLLISNRVKSSPLEIYTFHFLSDGFTEKRPTKFLQEHIKTAKDEICCFYYVGDDEKHFHTLWWSLALYKGKWFPLSTAMRRRMLLGADRGDWCGSVMCRSSRTNPTFENNNTNLLHC